MRARCSHRLTLVGNPRISAVDPVVLTQPGGDPDYAKIPATDGLGGREELEFVGVFATDEKGEVGELVVKGQRRGKDTD